MLTNSLFSAHKHQLTYIMITVSHIRMQSLHYYLCAIILLIKLMSQALRCSKLY